MKKTEDSLSDDATALEARDRQLSVDMIDEVEEHLDLSKLTDESEFLMRHLSNRYEEMLSPYFTGDANASPALMQRGMRVLVRQLARAQADIFALKGAVLGRDRLVMTQDWSYRDAVSTHVEALGGDLKDTPIVPFGQYAIFPDESMIGFGWYQTEQGKASAWRWSGPEAASGIFLPNIASGACTVQIDFSVLSSEVVPENGFVSVNQTAADYAVTWHDNVQATVTFAASPSPEAPHFLVELALAKTVSPAQLLGKSDTRQLGICMKKITYRPT